ncbi:potassium channel family protein [Corynebacterium freiburgense]|uniref:potassium channel family protein n=1 Tax=Corynebacterium freiburgense TaxID=556548 RepID=UPI0004271B7A|nr:potassium channel family protein [Corynebacterium freiburgense]WJZ01573.1 pH-gated potassium channel KcsA [Corynebacterium freiburgense]
MPYLQTSLGILREIFNPEIPPEATARERWERRVEGPMLVLSLVFLGFYLWSSLELGNVKIADAGLWCIWAAFAIDYLVRFALAEKKMQWFFRHPHELVLVILPMFRPLRVLRLVSILLVFQRFAAANIRVTVALYTVVTTLLILLIGSLTLYAAERNVAHSEVHTYWDALWWSVVTVTTVGYGDIAPVTVEGRLAAALLMLGGIGLVGVVTASAVSWLAQQIEQTERSGEAVILQELQKLREETAALREEVAKLREREI